MISDIDISIRLLLAAVLGSVIGFERERLFWAAGIRTHMLVSVGACLLTIVSAYGFQHAIEVPHVILDPSRVAAQVVSGIGFLGAGAILLKGEVVRGLTTAASIWAVAAIGLAAGGGLFFAAVISTVIILVILAGIKPLEEFYRARTQGCVIEVVAEKDAIDPAGIKKLLGARASQVRRVILQDIEAGGRQKLSIQLSHVSQGDISRCVARLNATAGVEKVEASPRPYRRSVASD
jgi:putative Mg2+ transporter-C (MgtC) family protein